MSSSQVVHAVSLKCRLLGEFRLSPAQAVNTSTMVSSPLTLSTLHKIYTFIEAQQDEKKIKQFFRQSELSVLLKNCRAGLDHATQVFKDLNSWMKIETGVVMFNNISEMKRHPETMHKELLELQLMSEPKARTKISSFGHFLNSATDLLISHSILLGLP
ncbi:hypothetical protein B0H13DRAFT_1865733 [Mycena leptocephala]|nr:hypothetical protein B0H13DRAFT_1865733 [Mycena leptocephala]